MEKTIVLASGNEGKAREFRAILEPLGFKIVLQKELGIDSIGVTYGYGSRQELEESHSTIIIDDCQQLNDIFK